MKVLGYYLRFGVSIHSGDGWWHGHYCAGSYSICTPWFEVNFQYPRETP